MKQPYKIINITLITYSGKRIPVNLLIICQTKKLKSQRNY